MPFWGRKADSSPADYRTGGAQAWRVRLGSGVAPDGPIVVVVSLTEQRAYMYRNGIAIGFTTVSTGKPGHETPTGIFTILQKDRDHHSSTYNDASMPYQERLTWDGVALHAGGLPGYPSSHGCVHLPSKLAEDLFAASHMGMTVVVVSTKTAPADVVHPAVLTPVDATTGAERRGSAPRRRAPLALAAGEVTRRPGLDHDQRRRSARDRPAERHRDRTRAHRRHCLPASRSARMRTSSRPVKGAAPACCSRARPRAIGWPCRCPAIATRPAASCPRSPPAACACRRTSRAPVSAPGPGHDAAPDRRAGSRGKLRRQVDGAELRQPELTRRGITVRYYDEAERYHWPKGGRVCDELRA